MGKICSGAGYFARYCCGTSRRQICPDGRQKGSWRKRSAVCVTERNAHLIAEEIPEMQKTPDVRCLFGKRALDYSRNHFDKTIILGSLEEQWGK